MYKSIRFFGIFIVFCTHLYAARPYVQKNGTLYVPDTDIAWKKHAARAKYAAVLYPFNTLNGLLTFIARAQYQKNSSYYNAFKNLHVKKSISPTIKHQPAKIIPVTQETATVLPVRPPTVKGPEPIPIFGAVGYVKCRTFDNEILKCSDDEKIIEFMQKSPDLLIPQTVNRKINDEDETLLHIAAKCCQPQLVKKLLDSNAQVNLQDVYGNTPLHALAACYNMVQYVADVLLEHGAEPQLINLAHNTALDVAQICKNHTIINMLRPQETSCHRPQPPPRATATETKRDEQ